MTDAQTSRCERDADLVTSIPASDEHLYTLSRKYELAILGTQGTFTRDEPDTGRIAALLWGEF